MNLFDLYAKITLETGDYERSIKNVVSQASALQNSMDDTANKTDTVSNRTAVLRSRYEELQNKISRLTAELNRATTGTNAASQQNAELASKLKEAQEEASGLQREMSGLATDTESVKEVASDASDGLRKFSSGASDASTKSRGLGDVISDLAKRFGIDLPDGLTKTLNGLGNLSSKVLAVVAAATSATAAIVKLEKTMINMTKTAAEQARQLINLSSAIGMNTTQAQEWDYVLSSVGSSLEEAQGDISMFQERMLEAATGEGEAAEMFAKLGVTVTDVTTGTLRPAGEVLGEVVERLTLMHDITDRNATSSILLGGTGEKLTAVYDQQVGTLDELIEKKRQNGIVSEAELEMLADTDTALRDLSDTTDTVKTKLASQFAPAMINATEKLGDFISGLGQKLEETGIVDAVGNILIAASGLLEPLGILVSSILPALKPLLDAVAPMLALLADTATVITGVLTLDWDTIKRGLGIGGQSASARLYNTNKGYSYNYSTGQWYDPNVKTYDQLYAEYDAAVTSGGFSGTFEAWQQSGGDVYNINIDAKNVQEFNDIVDIAQNQKRLGRMYA